MQFPEQTPLLVASNLLLILLIALSLYPVYFKRKKVPNWRVIFAVSCTLIFTLFSFCDTDWFHYQYLFNHLKKYTSCPSHMEDIYLFLIRDICPTFIIFRLLVWGTALLLFILTVRRIKIRLDISLLILGVSFLPIFSYARVTLAIALIIYGYIIIICPFKPFKYLSITLGLILLVSSVFFHKSAGFALASIIICVLWKKISKNSWFFIALVYALCIVISYICIPLFLNATIQEDADFAQSSQKYLSRSYGDKAIGIGRIAYLTLERSPYYLIAVLSYKILTNFILSNWIAFFTKFSIVTVLIATLFVFDFGANTGLFYARVLRLIIVPATIILCYAFQHKIYLKWVNAILAIAFTSTIYKLVYGIYISSMIN